MGHEQFTFSPLSNTAIRLAYWDEDAFVSELVVSAPPQEDSSKFNDTRVKSAADQAAVAAEREGLVAPGKETEPKTKKRKAEVKDTSKQKKVRIAQVSSLN